LFNYPCCAQDQLARLTTGTVPLQVFCEKVSEMGKCSIPFRELRKKLIRIVSDPKCVNHLRLRVGARRRLVFSWTKERAS